MTPLAGRDLQRLMSGRRSEGIRSFITLVGFKLVCLDVIIFSLFPTREMSRQKRIITVNCCIWAAFLFFFFFFLFLCWGCKSTCGTADSSAVENDLVYQVWFVCRCVSSVLPTLSRQFQHNMWTDWDVRLEKTGFCLFLCCLATNRLTPPARGKQMYTNTRRRTHSLSRCPSWNVAQRDGVELWKGVGAVSLTPTRGA